MDTEKLVNTYLLYFVGKQEKDRWAWDEVDDLVRRDPDRGWEITRLLVNKANSDEALGFVAAGPLEDLLKKWPGDYRPRRGSISAECATPVRAQWRLDSPRESHL